ncbi:hypothetical protein P3T73_15475 [Kiritimatiellota bacterium B12222]|nr:hypothetical protein P3T73_15475 [Kiritimatiellota bacterium B12222]
MNTLAKKIVCTLLFLIGLPIFGNILISNSGNLFTFEVLPGQSTPLSPGAANYSSGNVSDFHGIFFTSAASAQPTSSVVSNTLFDHTGTAISDSLVNRLFTDSGNPSAGNIVGFGNKNGFSNEYGFTVAGGTLVLEAFEADNFTLPESPITGLIYNTTFHPNTSGYSADLTPVTIPEATSVLSILFGLAVIALRKRINPCI